MKEFDSIPPCCENMVMPGCNDCDGFDEECTAYQKAMRDDRDTQQRFERDYAKEISAGNGGDLNAVYRK